jgi:hypothetical protein
MTKGGILSLLQRTLGIPDGPPRDALLHGVQGIGQSSTLRFAEQQVNVFKHNDTRL